ncbi:MAG: type I DNA topoisomerase [Deltaproteobacteria bacterium]|nr:type I DNA topoisomerase [Deltaproteobacteria bacterium]
MGKSLLIVESPAKAKTIKKYLGPDFEVKASVGHVVDLPPNDLGVDLTADFAPKYQIIKGKEQVIRDLKKAATKADDIYLAPDPDREGEAIAWHIAEQLGRPLESYHRVLFHELTKKAIQNAVAEPQALNGNRYNSQQARRVLDRLVGYQISPLLWDKVKRGLSAGRVQSVALRLVVERERAIQAFESQEFWTVTARLAGAEPPPFLARLAKLKNKKFDPKKEAEALAAVEAVRSAPFVVDKVVKKKRQQTPPPPFITSTLQQEAYRKLGFAPKYTMGLAQRLYEGMESSEGTVGLITYMRTDSTRLAAEAVDEARQFIGHRFGVEYVPDKPRAYKARAGAQEAHEAIRPTSAFRSPEDLAPYLKKDELGLYRLIWNRFLACQMAAALYDQTQAEISAGPALFRASGQVLVFKGFTALYTESKDEGEEGEDGNQKDTARPGEALPPLNQGQVLNLLELLPKQHFTQPPPRFSEASLVKELEEKGIGRPSTYAAILSTLQDKQYVQKGERRQLMPTELGMLVNDLLVENFPRIMEVDFTAQLEQLLDKVEEGQQDWRRLLGDFYGPFSEALDLARTQMRQIKGKGLITQVPCPACGRPMAIRLGKHGEFLACTGYPECKSTSDFSRDEKGNIVLDQPAETPDIACDKCGSPMQLKKGRYGPFLACTAYPACKNILPLDKDGKPAPPPEPQKLGEKCPKCGGELVIKPTRSGGRFISCANYPSCDYSRGLPTGVPCPQCGGQLTEKQSRRGKVFYGCENYPKCEFATWDRPLPEACPSCGHPFLSYKNTKKGPLVRCPDPKCRYSRPAEEGE